MVLPWGSTLPQSKYTLNTTHTIPARSGVAVPLQKNQAITVTNIHGTQVVDFWFLAPTTTPASHMSMCHTRASTLHLTPVVGDTLMSNHRLPLMEFVEDTTPTGIHDTLMAACDAQRYRELGVPADQYHDSCTDNFRRALATDVGVHVPDDTVPPDPLNLFMNIPVVPRMKGAEDEKWDRNETPNLSSRGTVVFERPVCREGDFVRIRALVEGVAVMSACPQDILRINDKWPRDAAFRVDG